MSTDSGLVTGAEAAAIIAEAHQSRQAVIRSRQVAKILTAYRRIRPDQPIRDWINGLGDEVYVLLSTAQEVVAGEAKDYVRDVLAVQGIDANVPDLNPRTFAGIASDGRDLESLLAGAPIRTAARARGGDPRAVQSGEQWLKMVVDTQISDAGRAADSVAIAAADAKVADVKIDPTRQELLDRLAEAKQRLKDAEERKKAQKPPKLSPGREADVKRRVEEGRQRRAEEARRRREAKAPPQRGKAGSPVRIGWVRMLTPPSCDRCIILAGRWYRWSEGFERHPMCFPAGTVISGPKVEAVTRRWFEGELVTIRTASGKELSVTGNHPILTNSGWVPASLIKEGDNVVRSLGANSALGQIPDDHQMPARVEDIFGAFGMVGALRQVPTSTEDFHGDGGDGHVDVVAPDGLLGDRDQFALSQRVRKGLLSEAAVSSLRLSNESGLDERILAARRSANGFMGSGGLSLSLASRHLPGAHQASIRMASGLHAVLQQPRTQGGAADSILAAEGVLAGSGDVFGGDLVNRQDQVPARFDPPAGSLSMETRGGYASKGKDLLLRLAGQVALDRVVEKVSRQWSGHVYNLTSSEGWMVSGGIVASNCDCRHIPSSESDSRSLLTNPEAYFDSLTEQEQDETFGISHANAIRDGADMGQVVNSHTRPGAVFVADGTEYTFEGTGKRPKRGQKAPILRPTVWQIYREAKGDREAAKQMLRRFRYLAQ